MNGVEYIRNQCKERGIPVSTLEKDLKFSNGYLNPKKMDYVPYEKAILIQKYLGGDISKMISPKIEIVSSQYYFNDETASIAQDIFDNRELRLLFDAARDAQPEDLKVAHDMLLALKRKERGSID